MNGHTHDPAHDADQPGGLVITRHRRHAIVEDAGGLQHRCLLKGRRLPVVCGDRVVWRAGSDGGDGLVLGVLPRDTELARPGSRGNPEVLAANLTQVLVVVAAAPPPDFFLLDRYLCAAELMRAGGVVIHNKIDLETGGGAALRKELGVLEQVAYPILETSARTSSGLADLVQCLAGHTSILVGQSGAGKSTLINALLPGVEQRTGALSSATGEGRHVTSAASLHRLPNGGAIIDSPGVREFVPVIEEARHVPEGFAEIRSRAPGCRFGDCRHRHEPDCAVLAALQTGEISERRYESYKRLLTAVDESR